MENNNTVQNVVHGFKVFRPDWTCSPNGNTKQYTCPGKFEEEGELDVCGHGMHFCQTAADCFNYYSFNSENKVAEVIAYGEVRTDGDKSCTHVLTNWKSCVKSRGMKCCESSILERIARVAATPGTGTNRLSILVVLIQKIMLFNKPSDMTYREWIDSDARYLLNQIPKDVVEWVYEEDMTDEEKAAHPTYETTGGYLKVLDESECGQLWWGSLSDRRKEIIKAIPNFDAEIFFQCTGVRVDE